MNDRIKALADYLEVDPETLSEGYDETIVETEDGEEYYVVTYDEAEELARESIEGFLDEFGITGFTSDFQSWILDNAVSSEWFEEAMRESNEFYFDDILADTAGSDEFETRAIEELYERGILTDEDFEEDEDGNPDYSTLKDGIYPEDYKDDFVESMMEDWDAIEWYRDNFGDEAFNEAVVEHNCVNTDLIVSECVEWDGIAHFIATYDGEELELEDGYYAYRIN